MPLLNQIEFEGLQRINLGPLLSDMPLADGVSATFLKPPKLDFSLVGLAKFANTPIIHSAIKKSLDQTIASQLGPVSRYARLVFKIQYNLSCSISLFYVRSMDPCFLIGP